MLWKVRETRRTLYFSVNRPVKGKKQFLLALWVKRERELEREREREREKERQRIREIDRKRDRELER